MKALVVFYSRTGNTRLVAETVARELNADLREVEEAKERKGPAAWLVGGFAARSGKCSEIKPVDVGLEHYDLIFVGSPVWALKPAPAINAFVSKADFKDKNVVVFFTMGASGHEAAIKDMTKKIEAKSGRIVGSFAIRCGGVTREGIGSNAKEELKSFSK